ncbi:FxsA family membrane protein [Streptomyces sulphureus]|uniref:FxsA family membrane protein n=1 Tax=Streptomyces sulphureus TaxID=47758 RepID=UPI000476FD32|nr:FxsA family membrane protein [Streptomyces sulphureus]
MTSRAPNPFESPREEPGGGDGRPTGPGRRRRGVSFLPLGVAAWAVLEIWLFTVVADAAGWGLVLLLLVAGFFAGAVAIKRAGRRAWRNLTDAVQKAQAAAARGEAPETEKDAEHRGNGLAMLGGLLLMIPGFVSDVAGLLCLFPPTARLLRRGTVRLLERRTGGLGDAYQQARRAEEQVRMHRPDGKVVQGEVVREDEQDGGDPGRKE